MKLPFDMAEPWFGCVMRLPSLLGVRSGLFWFQGIIAASSTARILLLWVLFGNWSPLEPRKWILRTYASVTISSCGNPAFWSNGDRLKACLQVVSDMI